MTVTTNPPFEYQSASCDIWQIAHLCNRMARHGWEPVSMADGHYEGAQAYKDPCDENSPMYNALKAIVVLFRRPADYNQDDD